MVPGHPRSASTAPPSHHLVGGDEQYLDKATALLPALLNERLPELGIDFALIYPSFGLTINGIAQDDLHRAAMPRLQHDDGRHVCAVSRQGLRPWRLSPAHNPDEALEELEYAVKRAWYQSDHAAGKPGAADSNRSGGNRSRRRPPGTAIPSPWTAPTTMSRSGGVASSSAWRSPNTPAAGAGRIARPISNFTYNHVGHFASRTTPLREVFSSAVSCAATRVSISASWKAA